MTTFRIKHKNCGMETTIEGYDIFDTFKKANKELKLWTVIEKRG